MMKQLRDVRERYFEIAVVVAGGTGDTIARSIARSYPSLHDNYKQSAGR